MTEYYQRNEVVHIDGTNIFQTRDDRRSEAEVAVLLGQRWNCSVRSFGALAPVDWYAERAGRLVGLLELKTRSHEHTRYSTVFLNVRKWLALNLGSIGLAVPAAFVVRFNDGVFWIPLARIDATKHVVGGCFRIVKSVNDIEPLIEVNVANMSRIV